VSIMLIAPDHPGPSLAAMQRFTAIREFPNLDVASGRI